MKTDWDECNDKVWKKYNLYTVDSQKLAGRFCGKFGKRKDLKQKQSQALSARVSVYLNGNVKFAEELQRAWDEGFSSGYSYFKTILEN